MQWMGHKRIDETMLYVHFAEGHLRPLPAEVLVAGRGVEDPDGKIVAMLGARGGVGGKKLARPLGPVKETAGASAGSSAERTGLEPAASGVTGRRYNQLNYRSTGGEPPTLARPVRSTEQPGTHRNPWTSRPCSPGAEGAV